MLRNYSLYISDSGKLIIEICYENSLHYFCIISNRLCCKRRELLCGQQLPYISKSGNNLLGISPLNMAWQWSPQTVAWISHLHIHSSFEQNHNITNRIACCCFLWHVLCLLFIRVDIPVIIMGETGCGKTKLIEFMSKLQTPTDLRDTLTTMIIVKVRCIKLNSISWHAPSFASYHIKSSSGFI